MNILPKCYFVDVSTCRLLLGLMLLGLILLGLMLLGLMLLGGTSFSLEKFKLRFFSLRVTNWKKVCFFTNPVKALLFRFSFSLFLHSLSLSLSLSNTHTVQLFFPFYTSLSCKTCLYFLVLAFFIRHSNKKATFVK